MGRKSDEKKYELLSTPNLLFLFLLRFLLLSSSSSFLPPSALPCQSSREKEEEEEENDYCCGQKLTTKMDPTYKSVLSGLTLIFVDSQDLLPSSTYAYARM